MVEIDQPGEKTTNNPVILPTPSFLILKGKRKTSWKQTADKMENDPDYNPASFSWKFYSL